MKIFSFILKFLRRIFSPKKPLNPRQLKALEYLAKEKTITNDRYQKLMGVSDVTATLVIFDKY